MVFVYQVQQKTTPVTRRDPLAEMIEKQGLKQGDVFVLKSNTNSGKPRYDVCNVMKIIKDKDGYLFQFSASKSGQITQMGGPEGAFPVLESKRASKKGSDMNGFYIQKLREGQSVYIAITENSAPEKAKIEKISVSTNDNSKIVDMDRISITLDYGKGAHASMPANLIYSIEPITVKAPGKKGF